MLCLKCKTKKKSSKDKTVTHTYNLHNRLMTGSLAQLVESRSANLGLNFDPGFFFNLTQDAVGAYIWAWLYYAYDTLNMPYSS